MLDLQDLLTNIQGQQLNGIQGFAAFAIGGILLGFILSIAIQCLMFFVAMCMFKVKNKGYYFSSHIGKLIIIGILSTILSGILSFVLNLLTLGLLASVLNVVVIGGVEFLCQYYITFSGDEPVLRKDMAIAYTALAILTVLL